MTAAGRPRSSAAELIGKGIVQSQIAIIALDETEAINKALDSAPKGSLVVILPEISRAIA